MAEQTINGVATLAVGNLVVMLLAVSIRQQRRKNTHAVPTLTSAMFVILFHAAVQTIAVSIASNFFESVQGLVAFAVILALLPTAWCLLLLNDWLTFRTATAASTEVELDGPPDMETARRYVVLGEYDDAKRAYLAYAKAHPKSAEPLFGLEGMYMSQGRFHDAADVCRQIVERFEHDPVVWTKAASRLADLLENQLRRPHDAEELRAAIARRNPGHASAGAASEAAAPVDDATLTDRVARAHELAQNGSTDSAISVLKALRQSNPRDPRPLFELAVIYEADLQTEAAKRTLETVVREFSGSPGIWAEASLKLSDLYLNRYGNDGAARELLERVVKNSPLPDDRAAAQARLDKLNHPWA